MKRKKHAFFYSVFYWFFLAMMCVAPSHAESITDGVDWQAATHLAELSQLNGQRTVQVCLIDSGVDIEHPAFVDQAMMGSQLPGLPSWYQDDVGHGSHMAGIISQISNGYDIRIISQRVTPSDNEAQIRDEDLVLALDNCAQAGADIINLSLSGLFYSAEVHQAINRAIYDHDAVIVAAAGNHRGTSPYDEDYVTFPAAYPGVIAVGAINRELQLADFSPRHQVIDWVAPGVDIRSSFTTGRYLVESIHNALNEELDFIQLDYGQWAYPDTLPINGACYVALSNDMVAQQALTGGLTEAQQNTLQQASNQCRHTGGDLVVLQYDPDTLGMVLGRMDIAMELPTLLVSQPIDANVAEQWNIERQSEPMIALSGTSQAAAVTSAGLAKLWSLNADASRHELIDAVMNTAHSDHAANIVGMGNGLVNFGAAHQRLQDPSSQSLCQPKWYVHKNYQAGDQVTFAGEQYIATAPNLQTVPEGSDSWQWIGSCDLPQQERWGHIALGSDGYHLQRGEKPKYNSLCSSYLASCSSGGSSFGNLPTVYANVPAILDRSSTVAGNWSHFDGAQFAMTELYDKLGGSGAVRPSMGVGSGSLGVLGRVQSRINLSKTGMEHTLNRHLNPSRASNKS